MRKLAPEVLEEAVALRRHLHQNPELGFEEHATSALIAERLRGYGYEVACGIAGTGVVASLQKGTSARSIALRADIDALPMQDLSGKPWASQQAGKAHACGHDGHTASLLAAARVLAQTPFNGLLRLIFQPAEENEGGARVMLEEGLFERFPVQSVYAMHNWPGLPVGAIVARDVEMMAAFGVFEIHITGKGAHGAMPHEGSDSLLAAAQLVTALQSITARNVSPLASAVVSVTQIHGGDAWNVLPEQAVLRGTTRWFAPEVGDLIEARMTALCAAIGAGFGCSVELRYERRYPSTLNTPEKAAFVRAVATEQGFDLREAAPSMAAEDFAFMLERVPGCYFWLGCGEESAGLHNPRYDFNDDLIEPAAGFWVDLVLKDLA